MGRVSDMAIGLEEAARDELLCEIDHWKERANKAEELLEIIAQHDGLTKLHPDEHESGDVQNSYSMGVAEGYTELVVMARAFLSKVQA